MSRILYVDQCVECPLFLILFKGEDEDEVYRCERTDLRIPLEVSNEHESFPDFCPLNLEEEADDEQA